MKENAGSNLSKNIRRAAMAIVAAGIVAAPAVYAKPKPKTVTSTPANVVAHVELAGSPADRMLLVKKDKKQYLLLGLDSSSRVAVFDVTQPAEPRTVDAPAEATGKSAVELKVVDDTLALFGSSGAETPASVEPKEIRDLSGVTAFVKDKAHGLIYVTNGEGLWIVKTKERAAADAAPDIVYDSAG
jgi:hypothetical protein